MSRVRAVGWHCQRQPGFTVAKFLLLYSSVYGLSRRICERLQGHLAEQGHTAEVTPLAGCTADLLAYDALVIGASIRQGKHNPAVLDFIRRHQAALEARPNAFFSVNLVARKPTKNTPETNPYLQRFLANCPWKPQLLGVFAGELDYARYGSFDRHAVRFIMWLNKGPTDLKTKVEFTNWDEVARFAGRVGALVPAPMPGAAPRSSTAGATPTIASLRAGSTGPLRHAA